MLFIANQAQKTEHTGPKKDAALTGGEKMLKSQKQSRNPAGGKLIKMSQIRRRAYD